MLRNFDERKMLDSAFDLLPSRGSLLPIIKLSMIVKVRFVVIIIIIIIIIVIIFI